MYKLFSIFGFFLISFSTLNLPCAINPISVEGAICYGNLSVQENELVFTSQTNVCNQHLYRVGESLTFSSADPKIKLDIDSEVIEIKPVKNATDHMKYLVIKSKTNQPIDESFIEQLKLNENKFRVVNNTSEVKLYRLLLNKLGNFWSPNLCEDPGSCNCQ